MIQPESGIECNIRNALLQSKHKIDLFTLMVIIQSFIDIEICGGNHENLFKIIGIPL